VHVGEEGDLLIRGPGRFLGYYKRPDIDAESITEDGYLRTGDCARLLDEAGHIRISGRTKDIIIRGGENIPVVEIENILLTHPAIREVALVPVPHDRLGETACACLVLNTAADQDPTVQELGEFLGRYGVAKQFYPESLRVMEALPRTPSGKIQKFTLRAQMSPCCRWRQSMVPFGWKASFGTRFTGPEIGVPSGTGRARSVTSHRRIRTSSPAAASVVRSGLNSARWASPSNAWSCGLRPRPRPRPRPGRRPPW
jgi:hypothetical protein